MGKDRKSSVKRGRGESSGIEILRNRYLRHDPEMAQMVEQESVNMEVGRTICDLREKAGLSQRGLAKLVGTTASVICRLENAEYEGHSLTMLSRVAKALNRRIEVRFLPLQ